VVVDNYQPTWNQVLSLKSPRGDLSVLFRLMGRNPQRVAFEEAAAHKRHLLQGMIALRWKPRQLLASILRLSPRLIAVSLCHLGQVVANLARTAHGARKCVPADRSSR